MVSASSPDFAAICRDLQSKRARAKNVTINVVEMAARKLLRINNLQRARHNIPDRIRTCNLRLRRPTLRFRKPFCNKQLRRAPNRQVSAVVLTAFSIPRCSTGLASKTPVFIGRNAVSSE